MRVLLDTHVWLWLATEPERIHPDVVALLADPKREVLVSVATVWEMCIKYGKGRLQLPEPPEHLVPTLLASDRFKLLAIQLDHAFRVSKLPPHHGDPFDRLLIAQSLVESIPIVTDDPRFAAYGVELVKAT